MNVITTVRPQKKSLPNKLSKKLPSKHSASYAEASNSGFFPKQASSPFEKKKNAFSSSEFSSAYLSASKPHYSTVSSKKSFHSERKFLSKKKSLFSGFKLSNPLATLKTRGSSSTFGFNSNSSFKKPSRQSFAFGGAAAELTFGIGSFPIIGGFVPPLLLLSAALCICAPALQNRFGFYFFEKKVLFDTDGASLAAMSLNFTGERNFLREDISLANDDGKANPSSDIIEPVSYSNYTVRRGDTVSAIALKFGLENMGTILSINGIRNARRISVGQSLRIPSVDGIIYKAVAGDTIASISSKFSVPFTSILDANDLSDAFIAVGQELFIPGATLSNYDLRKAIGELFIYPIRGRLTSRYGMRADPFTGSRTFHTGIDLAAPTGTSIKASTDGRVSSAGWQNVYGNYVIVTHGGGYQTLYAHMNSISVKRGQYVNQGDEVGKVGNTGYSTGPHLHFSVYKNGKTVNPFSVLD